jgi:hypothetical protein
VVANSVTVALSLSDHVVQTVELIAPADGEVLVSSTTRVDNNDFVSEQNVGCSISRDSTQDDGLFQNLWVRAGGAESLAGSRASPVTEGESVTVNLVCKKGNPGNGELMQALDSWLIAHFVAS